jgi:hypothetical protein
MISISTATSRTRSRPAGAWWKPAWQLDLPSSTLAVTCDEAEGLLIACAGTVRRAAVTGCRDALNGYQKGKCFYCFGDVSLLEGAPDLADVDHFLPHRLKGLRVANPIDGVWNLVLACRDCNRGESGKFDLVPELRYLERLLRRNEFLIDSHHPLRETLMSQTGPSEGERRACLAGTYCGAVELLIQSWKPRHEHEPAF